MVGDRGSIAQGTRFGTLGAIYERCLAANSSWMPDDSLGTTLRTFEAFGRSMNS